MSKYQFKSGDWNAQCDVCGRRFKASQILTRWDGVKVCQDDFELRHPQELIRGVIEKNDMPFTRPVNWVERSDLPTYASDGTSVPTGTFNISDPIGE